MKQALERVMNVLADKKADPMHKTMVLVTTGALLLAGGAFAVDGGEKISSTADTAEARVADVFKNINKAKVLQRKSEMNV